MNDYERRAFIAASGQVLTDHLPDDFDSEEWSHENHAHIDDWLVAHAWEPYEYWSANQLWDQIDSVANSLKSFYLSESNKVNYVLDLQR